VEVTLARATGRGRCSTVSLAPVVDGAVREGDGEAGAGEDAVRLHHHHGAVGRRLDVVSRQLLVHHRRRQVPFATHERLG